MQHSLLWPLLALVLNRGYFIVQLMTNCAVVKRKCALVKVSLRSCKCVKYFQEFLLKRNPNPLII